MTFDGSYVTLITQYISYYADFTTGDDTVKEKYRIKDFGKLILHWLVTVMGASAAFGIQYSLMEKTGTDGRGFLPVDIYSVNVPMFVLGAAIITIGYIFVWKLWLKKDLVRCIVTHWGWVLMYAAVALWNLALIIVLGYVSLLFHLPNMFSSTDTIAFIFPFISAAYMILFSVIEALITGTKRKE